MFRRIDGEIETRTEVVVSPEDDAELRRVSVTNHSGAPRSLDLTSYAEVVLAPADADLAHRRSAICSSRPRRPRT